MKTTKRPQTGTGRAPSQQALGPSWLYVNEGEGPVLAPAALLAALDHRWGAFRALALCRWEPDQAEVILGDMQRALLLFDLDFLDWRDAMKDSMLEQEEADV